ncbi:MAG: M48 family metalloprotease [Polyangiaceae bacterium]|nr:M48 family metalloprotease [Polyangiaceae bacterium]
MPFVFLVLGAVVLDSVARSRTHAFSMLQARHALHRVAQALGVRAPELRDLPGAANAFATANGAVLVDVAWLEAHLRRACGDGRCRESVLVFLMGHELAHVILGHGFVPMPGRTMSMELDADHVAGVAMGRLGVDPRAAIEVLAGLMQHACWPTHGCPDQRAMAIWKGYGRGLCEGRLAA